MSLHDLENEQALFGAVLISPRWIEAAGDLRPEHFFDPTHGALWQELLRRFNERSLIDFLSLRAFADRIFAEVGGSKYLLTLDRGVCTSNQVQGCADAIRESARLRALSAAVGGALAAAKTGERTAAEIITEASAALDAITLDDADTDHFTIKGEAAVAAVETASVGSARGVSWGFRGLDDLTGWLRPKLYLLGAASSMGKTTLAAAIARNVAAQGYGVIEFMLEMDEVEDGLRTASALAFSPDHRASPPHYLSAQMGRLSPLQWDAMRGAAKAAGALNIWTDYRQGRTLAQIESSARRGVNTMRKRGIAPGLVVIDHEGLIRPEPGARYPNQLEATNARAVGLLALPQRLGVPVLVTSQLTKEGKRADGAERLPGTDDLKYGGALVEAAYAVMLLHRRSYYAERKPDHLRSPEDWDLLKSREATIVVDKARGGRRGKVAILMDTPTAAVWEDAA